MVYIKIKILEKDNFLCPSLGTFCILYSVGQKWKIVKQSRITREWQRQRWWPMLELEVRWPSLSFTDKAFREWLIISVTGLNRWTVKILLRRPLLGRVIISVSLEETAASPRGLKILQNNLLLSIVEIRQSFFPLMRTCHLPKKLKMCYNHFKDKRFSLYWTHLLRLCLKLKERLLSSIYRKAYHMRQSLRKQTKRSKPYGKRARGYATSGGNTTVRHSRKKPNYKKIVDELVSEFSEEFCHGRAPDTTAYLNRLKKVPPRVKKDLHELLLSTKIMYLVYHPDLEKKSKESISELETRFKKLCTK